MNDIPSDKWTCIGVWFNHKARLSLEKIADALDFQHCTWSEAQLRSDMLNKALPFGMILRNEEDKILYVVSAKKTRYGYSQTIVRLKDGNDGPNKTNAQ